MCRTLMKVLIVLWCLSFLSACATITPPTPALDLPPGTQTGAAVNTIPVASSIRDWQIVGDGTILMAFNRQRRFLVELAPPCPSQLRAVTTLRLIPGHAGYLSIFDQVELGDVSCRIQSIHVLEDINGAMSQSGGTKPTA